MAKSRRKNGGPTRGRFKLKKHGKGWSTQRRQRALPRPRTPEAGTETAAAAKSPASKSSAPHTTSAKP